MDILRRQLATAMSRRCVSSRTNTVSPETKTLATVSANAARAHISSVHMARLMPVVIVMAARHRRGGRGNDA